MGLGVGDRLFSASGRGGCLAIVVILALNMTIVVYYYQNE